MSSFLERYASGEHEQVWDELLALGTAVREEPLYAEALAVARETMRRVRHNIAVLVAGLTEIGYQFGDGFFEGLSAEEVRTLRRQIPIFEPPQRNARVQIAALEQLAGTLPLSVRVFYEVVGAVNLVGDFPSWPRANLDPLLIYSVEMNLLFWHDWRARVAVAGSGSTWTAFPYCLMVAPDEEAKYGAEGGLYEIALPNAMIDAPLLGEPHHTTFVKYLRTCFQWGGFPGLERSSMVPEAQTLTNLREGLLPL